MYEQQESSGQGVRSLGWGSNSVRNMQCAHLEASALSTVKCGISVWGADGLLEICSNLKVPCTTGEGGGGKIQGDVGWMREAAFLPHTNSSTGMLGFFWIPAFRDMKYPLFPDQIAKNQTTGEKSG